MSHKDLAKDLNRILGKVAARPYDSIMAVSKVTILLSDDEAIGVFRAENVEEYARFVQEVWASEKELRETVCQRTVRKRCDSLLTDLWTSGAQASAADIARMIHQLEDMPVETWEVFRSLLGTTVPAPDPVALGPFTLYHWEAHKTLIFDKYPYAQTNRELLWHHEPQGVVASVRVAAREGQRAIELANQYFRRFQNALRYMAVRYQDYRDAGFTGFRQAERHHLASLSPTHFATSDQLTGSVLDVDLADPILHMQEAGHAWIWAALGNPHPHELMQRVLSAVDWVGMAVNDFDPARSFVQIIFALEALLTFQEKGVLVSPSIASQISEFAAFIITEELEERLSAEKTVKEFYDLRSKVAHGGSQTVTERQVKNALFFVKVLIARMVTHSELQGFSSFTQLRHWVQRQKYCKVKSPIDKCPS